VHKGLTFGAAAKDAARGGGGFGGEFTGVRPVRLRQRRFSVHFQRRPASKLVPCG